MSNLVNGIVISLSFAQDFENKVLSKKLVEIFLSAQKSVRPKKYGSFRPESKIVDLEDVANTLININGAKIGPRAGSLILEAGKNCGFQMQWNKTSRPSFSFIGGHLIFSADSNDEDKLTDFLNIVRNIVSELSPVYGEVRSMAVKNWDTPMNLLLRLPDIPAISIYGKEYIAFFGREKIEASPFTKVEKIGDCYWLVATESLMEDVPSALRAEIRSYFGEDSFMANGKWKYSQGYAPMFDLNFSICG